jgi:hypothetical protein
MVDNRASLGGSAVTKCCTRRDDFGPVISFGGLFALSAAVDRLLCEEAAVVKVQLVFS